MADVYANYYYFFIAMVDRNITSMYRLTVFGSLGQAYFFSK